MAEVLRVGMAGLGAGARQVLPSFKRVPGVQLTAVADIREKALDEFRARGVKAFDSVEAMCKSRDVDAVWIATPNVLHMEHAVTAAEHGKHVICEKPMALSLEQATALSLNVFELARMNYLAYAIGDPQPIPQQDIDEYQARGERDQRRSGRSSTTGESSFWKYQRKLLERTYGV